MAILSQAPKTIWVEIQGRRIKVFDDDKTQSVNICTLKNVVGKYEQKFYFHDNFRVTAQVVDQHTSLAALTKWLRERSYRQLQ
jgi:hypothetical protein